MNDDEVIDVEGWEDDDDEVELAAHYEDVLTGRVDNGIIIPGIGTLTEVLEEQSRPVTFMGARTAFTGLGRRKKS